MDKITQKKLIVIAHSMGGVVMLDALKNIK